MSFILKVAFVGLLVPANAGSASESASLVAWLVITQFSDQVRVKDTSHLINGMSSVLYFNGTTISAASFSTLLASNFPVILIILLIPVILFEDFESSMK